MKYKSKICIFRRRKRSLSWSELVVSMHAVFGYRTQRANDNNATFREEVLEIYFRIVKVNWKQKPKHFICVNC